MPANLHVRSMTAAAFVLAAANAAAEPAPAGVYLRYLNAPRAEAEGIVRSPKLAISFGGRRVAAVMDTGSTGIVVSASALPDLDNLPSNGPGRLVYSSSGRVMIGRWVRTPVRIEGSNGASFQSQPLPVLAVTQIDCLPTARTCRPEQRPSHVAMLGIGFGREADGQARSTPDTNPFLAGPALSGVHRGYVVGRQGVTVGLTDEALLGMQLVKLDRMPGDADWAGAPMCVSIQPGKPPSCGKLLVDTGVTKMFLTVPQAGSRGTTLPPGTQVQVWLGGGGATAPSYGFTVGQPGAMAPTEIIVVPRSGSVAFVNTGMHALNGFDVAYDAENGMFGLRSHNLPSASPAQ